MYPRVHEEPVIVAPSVYDYDDGYEIVDYDFYPSVSPYSMFRPYGGRRVRKRAGFDGFEVCHTSAMLLVPHVCLTTFSFSCI